MPSIGFGINLVSLRAQRQLDKASQFQTQSIERLSSGMRINHASDDPASASIASKLKTDSRIYSQGVRNLNDGISGLNLAQGALDQGSTILERIKELATQSANGSFSRTQRLALDGEAFNLQKEFNRIMGSVRFNGLGLYNSSISELRLQGGIGGEESLRVGIGSELRRNVGKTQFGTATTVSTDTDAKELVDIDNDGDLDVITNSGSGAVKIFKNSGTGAMTLFDTISATNLRDFTVSDFNGDGLADVFIVTNDSYGVVLNQGGGTFGNYAGFATFGGSFFYSKAGDYNNDGKQDVLIGFNDTFGGSGFGSGGPGKYLYVAYGSGTGTFTDATTSASIVLDASGSYEFQVSDLDSDGNLDIIDSYTSDGTLHVYYGRGNGSFETRRTYTLGGNGLSAAQADFNHDGLTDFLATSDAGTTEIFINNGNRSFTKTVLSSLNGEFFTTPTVGDIDGDGNQDIYMSGLGVDDAILLGDGQGGFSVVRRNRGGDGALRQNLLGDLNGDGVVDFVGSVGGTGVTVALQSTQTTNNIQRFDLTTQTGARSALGEIEKALQRIRKETGLIGSSQSRLDVAVRNLSDRKLGYEEARSRITDIEVATETANLTRASILKQTAQAVLAQANQTSSIALFLLKGE